MASLRGATRLSTGELSHKVFACPLGGCLAARQGVGSGSAGRLGLLHFPVVRGQGGLQRQHDVDARPDACCGRGDVDAATV
jgi:hypothetical protein